MFENIGTVYDGMGMMTKEHDVTDAPEAAPLAARKGGIVFNDIRFHYGKNKGVIDGLSLAIQAGRKDRSGWSLGRRQDDADERALLRFYDLESGRILIDGQ